jgi:hypothetical protein
MKGIPEWTLSSIITYIKSVDPVNGADFDRISSELTFNLVDKFSDQDPVDTGYKPPRFVDRFFKGCHRVYVAHQKFDTLQVQLLSGGPNTCGALCGEPPTPAGYIFISSLSQAVLKFHEIVLHRNWEQNKSMSLLDLESKTRNDIAVYLSQKDFFPDVMANYLKISKTYRTGCFSKQDNTTDDSRIYCAVAQWANVSKDALSAYDSLKDIWESGHGHGKVPTVNDFAALADILNKGYGQVNCEGSDLQGMNLITLTTDL